MRKHPRAFASPGEPVRRRPAPIARAARRSTYIMDAWRQSSRHKRCVPSGYGGFSSAQIRTSAIDTLGLRLACIRSACRMQAQAFIAQAPALIRQASGELDFIQVASPLFRPCPVLGTCRIGSLERSAVIWQYCRAGTMGDSVPLARDTRDGRSLLCRNAGISISYLPFDVVARQTSTFVKAKRY
ncbi:hypothetical protein EJ03DRAFT_174513 [Teratosphaeria nubilosa]|uniref:Uncharacterized protein n=1 Tax=Teratosphaeria nubilosa TaxID=161662 RepID=A0A6G1L1K4_9PEZI|nr:hypothetical protein EJ03DRAFT_174513 [Teratosphaeria nubilosa]